jgi:hypothetical protein
LIIFIYFSSLLFIQLSSIVYTTLDEVCILFLVDWMLIV